MTQTELSTKKETMLVPSGRHEVIFHDASQPTEYILEENSQLTLFDIAIDVHQRTSTVIVNLNGVGAEVEVYGLFFGADEETFDLSHEVIHRAPQTKSRIITRGALGGKARALYSGNIHIEKGVPGCDGRQEAHTLLLSREAHIDTVPHLEIGNNDVACAHSVSVSYIDEVKKFYCESRGLSEAEAIKAIIAGHFSNIIEKIQNAEFRMQIESSISLKLNRN